MINKDGDRYGVIDFDTNQIIGTYNKGGTLTARRIIAQHYTYLRCSKSGLCGMLDIIGSSKARIFKWLLENAVTDKMYVKNIIHCSQRHIAQVNNVSLTTVRKVIAQLKKKKLVAISTNTLILSPMLFFYGSDNLFLRDLRDFNKQLGNNRISKARSRAIKKGLKEHKKMTVKQAKNRLRRINKRQRLIKEQNKRDAQEQKKLEQIIAN